jgi:transposase InsO family protein
MGKDKLQVLLARQGIGLSVSMVGRILAHLRSSGQLRAPRGAVRGKVKRHPRPFAIRKPKDYPVEHPGDLLQVDTMELHVETGKIKQQFTAVDLVSRAAVIDLHTAATASLAVAFLDRIAEQFPAPVRAIQVDGGSEFMAEFEATCQARSIRLFVLPPRSPKLNGVVERTHRSCREEFYQCYEGPLDTSAIRAGLHAYQRAYTYDRPHQALGYRTPAAVLASFGYL